MTLFDAIPIALRLKYSLDVLYTNTIVLRIKNFRIFERKVPLTRNTNALA